MKRSILLAGMVLALSGCASFNFRPFAMLVCTSACQFDLKAPAAEVHAVQVEADAANVITGPRLWR